MGGKKPDRGDGFLVSKGIFASEEIFYGKKIRIRFTDGNNNIVEKVIFTGSDLGGSYGCMGACGAGCMGSKSPNELRYYLDCLIHDICSLTFRSETGPFDPHCGDEYLYAVDDWLLSLP